MSNVADSQVPEEIEVMQNWAREVKKEVEHQKASACLICAAMRALERLPEGERRAFERLNMIESLGGQTGQLLAALFNHSEDGGPAQAYIALVGLAVAKRDELLAADGPSHHAPGALH